jgi:F0F1-type ATP synthase membrane subunit c/vacuolar-type H+-ATPase subunit K
MAGELRAIAFLYFALVEATGLFGLVVAFLILFAF